MKTSWKFKLDARNTPFSLELPVDAWVVHVENGLMWIEGSHETMSVRAVEFIIIGTGHKIPPSGYSHVGTYQDIPFVWHVYIERF